jgi:hypothetical protein
MPVKPGDFIIALVKDVQPGFLSLDIGGKTYLVMQESKPMSPKRLRACIERVTKRWQEIMGRSVRVQAHAPRRYPMKQWQEDRKRLDEEG